EPPETVLEADASEAWSVIFRTWAQFAQTGDPMPLGNLNGFIVWASATWGVGAQPTVGEVREAYNTFFAGATSGNTDLQTAMAQIAASTDTDDADGTQLALALVHGAQSAYDARYEVFRADIITFGSQAARADTFADDVSAAIRTENQRV